MAAKKLTETQLAGLVDGLISAGRVEGVVEKGEGRFVFGPLGSADELRLDYDVTIIPPKKYFQPAREVLMTFRVKGGEFEPAAPPEPLTLIGVHPYDLTAINQMDRIFSEDNYDAQYMARREATRIIAVEPQNASAGCFAVSMGSTRPEVGYDLYLTRVPDGWLAEVGTAEGGKMLKAHAPGAADATKADLAARDAARVEAEAKMSAQELGFDASEIPSMLDGAEDHPVFEQRAERCFSCGSCNLVCPTCYCFDVQDEVDWDLAGGRRVRCWDGCLLAEFASVAGGHNFRRTRADRFRHRVYRKGKYIPDKIGELACVGCGRCVNACVADIANPVAIFREIKGVE